VEAEKTPVVVARLELGTPIVVVQDGPRAQVGRTRERASVAVLVGLVLAVAVFGAVKLLGNRSQGSGSPNAAQSASGGASTGIAQGVSAGDALVANYSPVKYYVAFVFAQSFRAWVGGQLTGDGAPTAPLSPVAAQAAAAVALRWAAGHEAKFAASSAPAAGGRNLLGYLEAHGVVCGSECGAGR
jgi:hypothetical protein